MSCQNMEGIYHEKEDADSKFHPHPNHQKYTEGPIVYGYWEQIDSNSVEATILLEKGSRGADEPNFNCGVPNERYIYDENVYFVEETHWIETLSINEEDTQKTNQLPKCPTDYRALMTIAGQYPQATYKLLFISDLTNLSNRTLRFKRNEICARFGQIIKNRGLLEHFSQLGWCSPAREYVDEYLPETEKANIELILHFELKF